jgi:hypothetical protein
MMMIAEAMQHTENRKALEISTAFAGQVGQYLRRVYMSFFLLTEEELIAYDPSKFFTSTEMIDTVPHLGQVFTEDRLSVISAGIPITSLPELQPWPTNLTSYYNTHKAFRDARADGIEIDDETTDAAPNAGGGPVMPPPPGP